jgi:hypothetical protein
MKEIPTAKYRSVSRAVSRSQEEIAWTIANSPFPEDKRRLPEEPPKQSYQTNVFDAF